MNSCRSELDSLYRLGLDDLRSMMIYCIQKAEDFDQNKNNDRMEKDFLESKFEIKGYLRCALKTELISVYESVEFHRLLEEISEFICD